LQPVDVTGWSTVSVSFTNTFNVAKTLNITAKKCVNDEWDLEAGQFDFRFQLLEKAGDVYKTTNVVVDGANGDGSRIDDENVEATVTFGTLLYTSDQLIDSRLVSKPNDDGVGDYVYQYHALMSEIEPSTNKLAGMTYSKAEYIVVTEWVVTKTTADGVTPPTYGDPYIKGVYAAVPSGDGYTIGEAVKTDFSTDTTDTGVTFTNVYTAQHGTSVTLTATKKLTGAARELKDNEFSFELYRWYKDPNNNNATKVLVETATNKGSVNTESSRTGTVTFTRNYPATIDSSFFDDTNDIATFIYQIKETPGGIPGMTYSNADYWVEVEIKHNQETASLSVESVKYYSDFDTSEWSFSEDDLIVSYDKDADSTPGGEEVVFTNNYTVKATSYAPEVTKQLLHWTNDGWKNDLTGYDKAFSFELVEVNADGSIVYIGEEGQQYAKVIATANNAADGKVTFAPIPYTGADLAGVQPDSEGKVQRTFYYMIREAEGTDPSITYNKENRVVYVTVVVEDKDSQLVATATMKSGRIVNDQFVEDAALNTTFTNYYGPYYLNLDLDLQKEVSVPEGGTYQMKDGEFDFNVYELNADGTKGKYVTSGTNIAPSGENKNIADVVFGTIQITQAQFDAADTDNDNVAEFKYVVEEQGSSILGITVDKPMIVTITVEDKEYGNLVQTKVVCIQEDHIAGKTDDNKFTNKYSADPTVLNLVASKTLIGKVLKENEFAFVLTTGSGDSKELFVDANGQVPVTLNFTAPGTYTYTLAEKTDNTHKNYTFDNSVYTIVVDVTDDGKGHLHAVHNIYKDFVDNQTNEPVGGMAFTNTYKPDGIEKDLSAQIGAQKTIVDVNGNKLTKPLSGYTFKVTDANGNAVVGKDGTTEIIGTSDADGKITFAPEFNFAAEGEYHYYIEEINDGKPGYEYDPNVWALHVLVRYNPGPDPVEYTSEGKTAVANNGCLYIADADVVCALKSTAAQQDDSGIAAQADQTPVFVNTYKPSDTSIHLAVKKELENRPIKAGEFTFRLLRKDASGDHSIIVSEATNDADGYVNFHITYKLSHLLGKDAREFDYKVVEVIPENAINGKLNGVSYDSSERNIKVTVKDVNGQIKAYWGDNEITKPIVSSTTFQNTYHASAVEVPISATKVLTDGDISTMSFNFELVDANGEVVQTVSNGTDGLIVFQPLTFTQADLKGETSKEFVYTLREKKGNLAAVTYDDTEYTVKITITDNLIGNLQYAVNYSNEDGLTIPVFTNVFDSTTNDTFATIQAKKTLTGKNLVADAFTFELEDKDGNILQAKNDSKGVVSFTVPYTAAGTYTYELREKAGTDTAMEYDTNKYEVVVEVTAGSDGRLGAVVTYKTTDGEMPTFQNIYTPAAAKVTLTGTKTLTGRDMKDGEFKFRVLDENAKEVATGTNTADGKITFTDIVLFEVGSRMYSVVEVDSKDDNITYDDTKFKVGVVVTNEDGVLKAEVTYEKDIKFSNTYTPDPTEPPTEAPTEEPTKPSKPSTDVPDTGDHMRMDIPIILLVISLVGMIVVVVLMKSSHKGKYRR